MEVAMPVAGAGSTAATAMDSYEDMFKEITRKLYGEDGLPDLASGEKLTGITTSVERGLTGIDYDVDPPVFKPEEHITAFGLAALMQNGFPPAGILNPNFQQAKPTTAAEDKWITNDDYLQWTQSKIASYNPSQKLFRCADCDCVGFLTRVAEHWLGTHANLRVFQCPQCPYASAWARCVRMHLARQHNVNSEETVDSFLKENPVFHEITRYLQRLKGKFEGGNFSKGQSSTAVSEHFPSNGNLVSSSSPRLNGSSSAPASSSSESCAPETSNSGGSSTAVNGCASNGNSKRYSCSYCPYATDRRDLFTRHENIHREEKPFQCYVCQKQFNRADHVKKHFLRMHREHPYDLNRIRRHPPKNASGMSYYHKYNNGSSTNSSPVESVGTMPSTMQHQLTIPNGFGGMTRVEHNIPNAKPASPQTSKTSTNVKTSSSGKSSSKKKGEKRYSCCYCSWSGVDNWCLKRHLNTHLKPFVCGLCDYKAARSERLATHVLKVHNKRACGRCLFMADDQVQLSAHQQEHHPLEQRNNRSSNVLRNNSFNTSNQSNQPFGHGQSLGSNLKPYELSAAAAILQHGSRLLPMAGSIISNSETKPWKPYTPKQHGAARLFNYMEASDGSDPECDTTASNDDINRMSTSATTQRNQSDFPEAGDVGNNHQGEYEDEYEEEMELPLFICRECGCEFVDDTSLETHQYTYHRVEKITSSPANPKMNRKSQKKSTAKNNTTLEKINLDTKENVNPKSRNYNCSICKLSFSSQINIMSHMRTHTTVNPNSTEEQYNNKKQVMISNLKKNKCINDISGQESNLGLGYCYQDGQSMNGTCKRSRKQSQPRKVVPPLSENPEIQVKKRSSSKHRSPNKDVLAVMKDKYMSQLMNKKGLSCTLCKKRKFVFTFRTRGSLALHCFWRHSQTKPFECEHCNMRFRHRYQALIHASEAHVNNPGTGPGKSSSSSPSAAIASVTATAIPNATMDITVNGDTGANTEHIVPNKLQTKEPILRSVTVPAAAASENPQVTTDTILSTNVPDNSTSTLSADKLSMHPYMEHPMLNSNIPVNNHIPIVIPTFPPS